MPSLNLPETLTLEKVSSLTLSFACVEYDLNLKVARYGER